MSRGNSDLMVINQRAGILMPVQTLVSVV